MMKLFTQKLKLCAAACALLAFGCPQQASADDITSGQYYHIAYYQNVDNVKVAFHYRTHRLQWDTYDNTAPEQIFRIEKADGENEYYLQSLSTGEYLSGTTGQYEMEMQGSESNRITVTITSENTTSTIKVNGNKNSTFEPYWKNHSNGNKTRYTRGDYTNNNRWGLYKNWWFASRSNNWIITKATDEELYAAKLKLRLIDAYKIYNQTTAYNLSETGLISIPSNASDLYGTGTPLFVSLAQSKQGNDFTKLVDGNTGTYFQATYDDGTYKGSTTSVTAPQFFQVDLGEGVTSKGVQMKMGLRDGQYGASSQPAEVTLYATNDADAAASDFTISACDADSKWTKIGTSKLTEEYAVSLSGGVANWKTVAANTYITENFGLKNTSTGYRYLRFYVNKVFFPNSPLFDFTFGELQFYNLDNIEIPEPKKLDAGQLLLQINAAENDLKNNSSDALFLSIALDRLNTPINNLSTRDYITISDLGYASFYSEENVTLPTGLEAFAVTATTENTATLTSVAKAGDVLPAKTPVILKGDAGNYVLTVTSETGTAVTGNLLSGTYTPLEQAEGTTYYVLSKNSEGKAALMKYNTGNVLHSGKAYLIGSTASPKYINFSFDNTTGIQSAVNEENQDTKTYDLEGRSVKHPQKGIYIRGGKKVILK